MSLVAPVLAIVATVVQPGVQHTGLWTTGALAQATVTVRIVSGTAIRFDRNGHFQANGGDESQPTYRSEVTLGGTQVPAAIAEFQ
jgi:hypothetical protein